MSYKSGLPVAIGNKIYKTSQTRGADKDTIFQNRVLRNSTVLIPFRTWNKGAILLEEGFENGFIVLAYPEEYFEEIANDTSQNLTLGENLLVFYETRKDWLTYPPQKFGWDYAKSRTSPLLGQYCARVPDTTSETDQDIRIGFTNAASGGQGAGIRVYEYASKTTLELTRYQLAYLAWRTVGMYDLAISEGIATPEIYKAHVDEFCANNNLIDVQRLEQSRLIKDDITVCPLCLKPISAIELGSRLEQAEGRFVPDLTVTGANLFHVNELRTGLYNHSIYNLGWGHHHCNTVARDYGISPTIEWMGQVLTWNGYSITKE
ncbi:BstXI family restriction endonuclease [Paenibacillus sp. NEAU-GSW1]|nr:BstXI family restriction endonuclease [Paenibacillus sp. NEAU-GSW1]